MNGKIYREVKRLLIWLMSCNKLAYPSKSLTEAISVISDLLGGT